MYDQSFNENSIARELRKSDFLEDKRLRNPAYKENQISSAVQRAEAGFAAYDFLAESSLRGKRVFSIKHFPDELVRRKVCKNIKKIIGIDYPSRDDLVSNIANLIGEGLPYRIYRLDLQSFYESIPVENAKSVVFENRKLSIPTKRFISQVLDHHKQSGHPGLPRGLGVSAMLSELILKPFDQSVEESEGVYYYGRFVDDIIIVTNRNENEKIFLAEIKKKLPPGLSLNNNKQKVRAANSQVAPYKPPLSQPNVLDFEFLGYKFVVSEPIVDGSKQKGSYFRDVSLDIAESKVKKIKTRIVRSIIDFVKNGNFDLLELRIKYLTSNFSVMDAERQQKRLAGIYHNYWLVNSRRSKSLKELDAFLRCAILSGTGKVFDKFYAASTYSQRRKLLTNSFLRGFESRLYLHFSKESLLAIQRCWLYA